MTTDGGIVEDLTSNIEKLEKEIDEKKKLRADYMSMDSEFQLAIYAHKALCRHNHTDGCGFHYDSDIDPTSWQRNPERKKYLERARKILAVTSYEDACKIIDALRGL